MGLRHHWYSLKGTKQLCRGTLLLAGCFPRQALSLNGHNAVGYQRSNNSSRIQERPRAVQQQHWG